jgi:hypothetical protein
VKTNLLLADIEDFNRVNAIYREIFQSDLPARSAYQVLFSFFFEVNAIYEKILKSDLPACSSGQTRSSGSVLYINV